jgi:nucleoside-diphosphate-sugar epimerase
VKIKALEGSLNPVKICVTGASGFLGKAITSKLAVEGYRILALSRLPQEAQSTKIDTSIDYLQGSTEEWRAAIVEFRPEIIISCDWEGVGGEARNHELQSLNVERVSNLGLAAKEVQAKLFLTFGSQAEVLPAIEPIGEGAEDHAANAYGAAKIELRKNLGQIFVNSKTKFIWGRIFTIYGPGDNRNSVITECILKSLNGEPYFIENPNKKWSFLYIDDFTDAVCKIIERDHLLGVVNVGNPNPVKLSAIPDNVGALLGILRSPYPEDFPEIHESTTTWIPKTSTLDSIGWYPKILINDGIKETLHWWQHKV